MNKNLGFRKKDNAGGVVVQELPHEQGSIATCSEQEDVPYNLSIANAVIPLQPSLKERTNYRWQNLVLSRVCDNNYYRVSVDVEGLNRADFFDGFTHYRTVDVATPPAAAALTWSDSLIKTQIADKVELGLNLIVGRLKKIGQLKRNWDSYGADPIELATIVRAIDFFSRVIVQLDEERRDNSPVPFVAPLADGGIQFEWRTFYKELIITIPKSKEADITYLTVEKDIFREIEEEGKAAVVEDAIELATTWLLS